MSVVINSIKWLSQWANCLVFTLCVGVCGTQQDAIAQSFPVQINAQVMPPAPIYLGDYANANTSNSPLRVQVVLNDLTITNREIRLRASMEGNGIRIQSNEFIPGVDQLFLEGGIPLNLTNLQLAPYFQFENITGVSAMQYGEALPEGVYQFCFEVIDVLSGNRLSDRTCATTVIFQNDPPFLVAPANLTAIEERNPQNIVFQWTPRHINSSNVEYELSLVELWDNVIDYQAAFLSSPPFFQVTTRGTSYLYGPAEPLLLKDKKYAWRVQAKALQGNEEIGLFKNQGYSEIFVFGHTVQCDFPTGIIHQVKGSTNVNVSWTDFSSEPTEFVVRYRELGNQNEWFFSETSGTTLTLWELRPGTNYEYQVAKRCALAESGFSPSKTFTTLVINDRESIYDCGISPEIDIASQTPLQSLEAGDQFTAGDFPVTVLEVNGGQGRFNGKGYVTIPYLRNVKVAVEFTNVFVNDQRQLAEGLVETLYDPTLSSIIDPFEWVDDVGDIIYGGDVTIYQPVDFEIEAVEIIEENGVDKIRITGTDENGNPAEVVYNYDPGDRYQITGGDTVYSIDEEGNLSEVGVQAEGGRATANNTAGVGSGGSGTSDDPSVEQIADEDVVISYVPDPDAKFGFDRVEGAFEEATYPKVQRQGGGEFYPVHKAVGTGSTDHFFVDVDIRKPDLVLEDLIFKTINGVAIETEVVSSNRLQVTVRGSNGYRSEEAIVTYQTAAEDQVVVSSFFIHHLKRHQAKVHLVGVNNASVPTTTSSYLTELYASAGADLQVEATDDYSINRSDWDLNGDGQLNYDGSGILANHPDEFRAIYNHFRQAATNYAGDTYYVFVMGPDIQPDVALGGFMPKGSQFGFVFDEAGEGLENKGNLPEVIAHELGHGIFNLQHPFDDLVEAGRTDWLMDYGGGDLLSIVDWAQMGFDGLQINWFDKDDEGAYSSTDYASKVMQLFRCANANGLSRAYPGYFGGGGSFSLGTLDLGDRRLSGVRITIKPEETIFDQVATIGRERKWTYDPYQGNQVRWEYFLDYGGVVFTRVGAENDGALESDLFRLQSYLFNYDLDDVRGDFDAVNRRIQNKTRLTDSDIRDIKSIANCAAILFDAPTRFKIIAAIAHNTYWLREYREDLLLDLMATAPASSYDALLRFFQQGLESHPESGPETYRILFSGVNAGNNRNRLLDELFQFWSNSSYYSEYHNVDGGNYDVNRRDEEFYREFRKEIERFIFGTPAPDCLTNTQEVTEAYNLHECLEAATASDLMNLGLEDRKHAMKVLLEFPFRQQIDSETPLVTGGPSLFRKSLFRLVKLIPDGQKDAFMSFLKDEKVYIQVQLSGLLYENTETTRMTPVTALWRYLDGDARKELLEGFVRLKSGSTSLQTELAELSRTAESLDLAAWRSKGVVLYNFDYRNILRRLWTALPLTSDDKYFTLSTDFSERTGEPLVAITQLESNGFSSETIGEELPYDPFGTILFVNQSKLSQLTNFNYQVNSTERIIVPAPAILAHYAVSLGAEKTMDDIVQTTIDVGTLLIPGGQITALGRALLYADRVSSLASIGATYTSDSDDDL
ncbi:MAG: fibronectin type III domain-containing protein, partial [Bacteroidota bacterium]